MTIAVDWEVKQQSKVMKPMAYYCKLINCKLYNSIHPDWCNCENAFVNLRL